MGFCIITIFSNVQDFRCNNRSKAARRSNILRLKKQIYFLPEVSTMSHCFACVFTVRFRWAWKRKRCFKFSEGVFSRFGFMHECTTHFWQAPYKTIAVAVLGLMLALFQHIPNAEYLPLFRLCLTQHQKKAKSKVHIILF